MMSVESVGVRTHGRRAPGPRPDAHAPAPARRGTVRVRGRSARQLMRTFQPTIQSRSLAASVHTPRRCTTSTTSTCTCTYFRTVSRDDEHHPS